MVWKLTIMQLSIQPINHRLYSLRNQYCIRFRSRWCQIVDAWNLHRSREWTTISYILWSTMSRFVSLARLLLTRSDSSWPTSKELLIERKNTSHELTITGTAVEIPRSSLTWSGLDIRSYLCHLRQRVHGLSLRIQYIDSSIYFSLFSPLSSTTWVSASCFISISVLSLYFAGYLLRRSRQAVDFRRAILRFPAVPYWFYFCNYCVCSDLGLLSVHIQ
jgi:hypothetical protein